MVTPVVINPVNDVTVQSNAQGTILNLFNHFDDPATTGQIARFQLHNSSVGNGIINIVLFDQANAGAPLTVQNFLNYVNDDDYVNTIIHRSVPGFVIQGGGFNVEQLIPSVIPADPPVQNEFSPIRSNLRGTIAMAKVGGNPDSATNQWFFNLANNSSNLDNQNGGFTVFGQVLSNADLVTIDAIAAVPIFNGSGLNPAFNQIPLLINPPSNPLDSDDDFVRFSSITTFRVEELQFTVIANSNPTLVNPTIVGQEIRLDYLPNQAGTAEITIAATNLLGQRIEDTFTVTVGFDAAQYGASHPDLIRAFGYNLEAFTQHYFNSGRFEGRSLDNFNEFRYIASHRDLINAFGANGAAATEHYIRSGLSEGRSLTAFDPNQYLASHSDLITAFGYNPTEATFHYILDGVNENRFSDSFDEFRYIASNPGDLINAFGVNGAAATEHYIRFGFGEGRSATRFIPSRYLNSHQDLRDAFGTDLTAASVHYIQFGVAEGRNPNLFPIGRYIASHPDLIRAFRYNLEAGSNHYLFSGIGEGRGVTFDPLAYLNRHSDLRNAFGNDLVAATRHYILNGFDEGRAMM